MGRVEVEPLVHSALGANPKSFGIDRHQRVGSLEVQNTMAGQRQVISYWRNMLSATGQWRRQHGWTCRAPESVPTTTALFSRPSGDRPTARTLRRSANAITAQRIATPICCAD